MARPRKNAPTIEAAPPPERLYQKLAKDLFSDLVAGRYAVGDRLPAERELSVQYNVSRPAVREAMIALEVQGLIEVRIGSGAYVRKLPGETDAPGFTVTAFELMEARLLIEGEAAALAAVHIREDELDELERLVAEIERENLMPGGSTHADQAFHMLIATATRNAVIRNQIEEMWRLRAAARKGTHRQCPAGGRRAQGRARCIARARSCSGAGGNARPYVRRYQSPAVRDRGRGY